MVERTLLIIKPDAVKKNLIGEILRRVEEKGYRIAALKMIRFAKEEAEAFYAVHHGKAFYDPLIVFMTSGPCVPVIVTGENVVAGIRELIGATDPAKAEEGTIRKDFAETVRYNAVHASDSPENAAIETAFFFSHLEVY